MVVGVDDDRSGGVVVVIVCVLLLLFACVRGWLVVGVFLPNRLWGQEPVHH